MTLAVNVLVLLLMVVVISVGAQKSKIDLEQLRNRTYHEGDEAVIHFEVNITCQHNDKSNNNNNDNNKNDDNDDDDDVNDNNNSNDDSCDVVDGENKENAIHLSRKTGDNTYSDQCVIFIQRKDDTGCKCKRRKGKRKGTLRLQCVLRKVMGMEDSTQWRVWGGKDNVGSEQHFHVTVMPVGLSAGGVAGVVVSAVAVIIIVVVVVIYKWRAKCRPVLAWWQKTTAAGDDDVEHAYQEIPDDLCQGRSQSQGQGPDEGHVQISISTLAAIFEPGSQASPCSSSSAACDAVRQPTGSNYTSLTLTRPSGAPQAQGAQKSGESSGSGIASPSHVQTEPSSSGSWLAQSASLCRSTSGLAGEGTYTSLNAETGAGGQKRAEGVNGSNLTSVSSRSAVGSSQNQAVSSQTPDSTYTSLEFSLTSQSAFSNTLPKIVVTSDTIGRSANNSAPSGAKSHPIGLSANNPASSGAKGQSGSEERLPDDYLHPSFLITNLKSQSAADKSVAPSDYLHPIASPAFLRSQSSSSSAQRPSTPFPKSKSAGKLGDVSRQLVGQAGNMGEQACLDQPPLPCVSKKKKQLLAANTSAEKSPSEQSAKKLPGRAGSAKEKETRSTLSPETSRTRSKSDSKMDDNPGKGSQKKKTARHMQGIASKFHHDTEVKTVVSTSSSHGHQSPPAECSKNLYQPFNTSPSSAASPKVGRKSSEDATTGLLTKLMSPDDEKPAGSSNVLSESISPAEEKYAKSTNKVGRKSPKEALTGVLSKMKSSAGKQSAEKTSASPKVGRKSPEDDPTEILPKAESTAEEKSAEKTSASPTVGRKSPEDVPRGFLSKMKSLAGKKSAEKKSASPNVGRKSPEDDPTEILPKAKSTAEKRSAEKNVKVGSKSPKDAPTGFLSKMKSSLTGKTSAGKTKTTTSPKDERKSPDAPALLQSHTRLLSTSMAAHGVSRGQSTIVLIEDQYV